MGTDQTRTKLISKSFLIWQNLPIPVIAAIEGFCFGAGMQLALAADIRIATPLLKCRLWKAVGA
jgi:enoyl-CoA hydratase/carnithine racemase